MVPLLLAAYMELRAPGTTAVPAPVPIVQVHRGLAQELTQRLADTVDVGSALMASSRSRRVSWATDTGSAARYAGPRSETGPAGSALVACALFVQTF